MTKRVGIDIGSTTIKAVVLDRNDKVLFKTYLRHKSSITNSLTKLLDNLKASFENEKMFFNFTGSAGMHLSFGINAQFTQEVISATKALQHEGDDFDVCIELGGEDAKIIFFDGNNIEQRMNGTCAGGTGAFIDQMATLIDVSTPELNELAKNYNKIYPIASRCGVFAKSDIQPLLNEIAKDFKFQTGKVSLNSKTLIKLDAVVAALNKYPNINLEIVGNTDNTGSKRINQPLSEKRAKVVSTYLVKKGIPAERLNNIGVADTNPVDTNKTSKGRASNRRTDMNAKY